MNHHKNGTPEVGAPGSYRNLLSSLEDLLKGKPKVFEVHHLICRIAKEGSRLGLSDVTMAGDIGDVTHPKQQPLTSSNPSPQP